MTGGLFAQPARVVWLQKKCFWHQKLHGIQTILKVLKGQANSPARELINNEVIAGVFSPKV